MAVLTADTTVEHRGEWGSQSFPVVGSEIIYKGAIVCVDADGYLTAGANTDSLQFAGFAEEQVDNSTGSSGDKDCKVSIPRGDARVKLSGTGFAQTDVGAIAYISDDQTIANSDPGNSVKIGRIIEYVSSTVHWVACRPFGVV
jgi:hypothetical protein